jgi:hypothetical protein
MEMRKRKEGEAKGTGTFQNSVQRKNGIEWAQIQGSGSRLI